MTLRLTRKLEKGLIEGSLLAAAAVGRAKWAASSARRWIREFWRSGELPKNLWGAWNESIIEDEDLRAAIQEHLRCIGRYCSPTDVVSFFDTPEAAPFTHLLDNVPSLRTAQHWMTILGYKWGTERQGQFADGHERADVVDYRQNTFIPTWMELERRMSLWEDGKETPPELSEDEQEVMPHWHDETIYRAHNRRFTRWMQEGETAGLYKKGEGLSLMVADFVSERDGFLRRHTPSSARVVFRPGKERDGYFCNKNVCDQLERAIQIAKEEYPDYHHVFIFDNATTHTKLPEDAPVVSKMTLGPSQKVKGEGTGPSGEKVKMDFRPGYFSDGSPHALYYPVDHPKVELRGAFKGLAKILEERGIPDARKLRLHCPTGKGQAGCPLNQANCCARKIMVNQPDILKQKTILQLLAESHNCSVLYLPKYHCELNPIEQCWGAAKRVYRDTPMSSTEADLIRNTLDSLDSVKIESIRRFAAQSRRFIYAYRDGLDGEQAAWANKRYRGHRVTTETAYGLFDGSKQ
ncbi:hypothetical protein BDV93DRAFT_455800 [Ceratobasidium sp. AG-I]|nr:hypothetical protein BDV93DRAFT_455800 [Ceratobasidium sp. AG-I]